MVVKKFKTIIDYTELDHMAKYQNKRHEALTDLITILYDVMTKEDKQRYADNIHEEVKKRCKKERKYKIIYD